MIFVTDGSIGGEMVALESSISFSGLETLKALKHHFHSFSMVLLILVIFNWFFKKGTCVLRTKFFDLLYQKDAKQPNIVEESQKACISAFLWCLHKASLDKMYPSLIS